MKTSKVFWDVQLTKAFKISYDNLSLKDHWVVKHFLNNIRYFKDPKRHYAYETCPNCPPNYCLFGMSIDEKGKKGVSVLIIIGKNKILTGVVVKRI